MASGKEIVQSIFWIVIVGLCFWLLWWGLHAIKPPQPFMKVGEVLLILASVILLINFLLGLIDHSFIKW